MLSRCTNPADADWPDYGGRGIAVCERWSGEDGWHYFFEDMGARPTPKHTIDRVDNSRGYSPENCRWATMKEQARNRRGNRLVTVNGQTLCASAWAEMFGIQRQRFIKRLDAEVGSGRRAGHPSRRAEGRGARGGRGASCARHALRPGAKGEARPRAVRPSVQPMPAARPLRDDVLKPGRTVDIQLGKQASERF